MVVLGDGRVGRDGRAGRGACGGTPERRGRLECGQVLAGGEREVKWNGQEGSDECL